MLLPPVGFDISEAAILWFQLWARGHSVQFATRGGVVPRGDRWTLTGMGPGGIAGASTLVAAMYRLLRRDARFRRPMRLEEVTCDAFDGLVVIGGDGAPVRHEWMHDDSLRAIVARFVEAGTPIAAIGRGVELLARTQETDARRDREPSSRVPGGGSGGNESPDGRRPISVLSGRMVLARPVWMDRWISLLRVGFHCAPPVVPWTEPSTYDVVAEAVGPSGTVRNAWFTGLLRCVLVFVRASLYFPGQVGYRNLSGLHCCWFPSVAQSKSVGRVPGMCRG